MILKLYKDNSMYLRALVADEFDAPTPDASVEATITDLDGNVLVDAEPMEVVAGQDRYNFQLLLDSDLAITAGVQYRVKIVSTRGLLTNTATRTALAQNYKGE